MTWRLLCNPPESHQAAVCVLGPRETQVFWA
jgi:hypothetical protein